MTWEVAISKGQHARVPTMRDATPGPEMSEAVSAVLSAGYAVIVTRTDSTPEARRERWESEFYDIDRAGRRRRRYRKSQIEREWEEFFAGQRREARAGRSLTKAGNLGCDRCAKTWSRKAPDSFDHQCDNPEGDTV